MEPAAPGCMARSSAGACLLYLRARKLRVLTGQAARMPRAGDISLCIDSRCRPGEGAAGGSRPAEEHLERRIGRLATRQYGVVSRSQLLGLGLGPAAIDSRLAVGRLHGVFQGVYAVGHPLVALRGRWLAAVLASGDGAALSHDAAAALWGIAAWRAGPVDVTTARRGLRGAGGVRLHRSRRFGAEERTVRDGIPATGLPRTLVDLAARWDAGRLGRAVEEADRLGLLELGPVSAACERHRGRRGLPRLRAVVEGLEAVPVTRSELEHTFLGLCRRHGIPPPVTNVSVAGREVDAHWPAARLIVELDGHRFHRTRGAFERDRLRDAEHLAAGYRVLRLTHRRIEREAAAVASLLRRLLAA